MTVCQVDSGSIMIAVFGCQLYCIWNELQFRNGGHSFDLDLKARRHHTFDPSTENWITLAFYLDLEDGRHTFYFYDTFYWKENRRRKTECYFSLYQGPLSTSLMAQNWMSTAAKDLSVKMKLKYILYFSCKRKKWSEGHTEGKNKKSKGVRGRIKRRKESKEK